MILLQPASCHWECLLKRTLITSFYFSKQWHQPAAPFTLKEEMLDALPFKLETIEKSQLLPILFSIVLKKVIASAG